VRLLDPALVREANQLNSTHVWTMAFELQIENGPVPYRVVSYDQPLVFHGLTFLPMPLAVDSLEEATAATLVHLRVTMENVSREFQSLLENYWASVPDPYWIVTIWQLDMVAPNLTPFSAGEVFSVQSVPTDLVTAQPDLLAEGITLSRVVPGRRYTTSSGFLHIPRR
jgi:hypothetical protein